MIYHSSKAEEVLKYFEVDPEKGLPTGVADQRLEQYGENIISNTRKVSLKDDILALLTNHINILLLVSIIISLIINITYERANWYSPILIFIMFCINIAVTVYNKKQCDKVSDSLKSMNSPKVKVLRDSIIKTIDSSFVVPGDILVLENGDYVAADARLIKTVDFRCNESFVTGEELSAEKNYEVILDDISPVEERVNMIYSGSNVITGHARAVVTETGMNTEVGKAVTILEAYNTTDVQFKDKLASLGKVCAIILSVFCAIAFMLSILLNFNSDEKFAIMLIDSFVNSLVLLVSLLPNGLPIMAAVAVGYSVNTLIKNGLIIKDFSVLDILPEVSVICSDKTGTLTQDTMQTEKIFNGKEIIDSKVAFEDKASVMILRLASLCTCQTKEDIDTPMYNDATELSIINAYEKCVSIDQRDIYNHYPCLCKLPFDPERKITITVNMIDGVPYAISKGAPDYLLSRCKNGQSELISNTVTEFASLGMRVIAVAFKQLSEIPSNLDYSDIDEGMNFAGLIALSNPPQNDSVSLIEECGKGGIRTIMITGDHVATAKSVAKRLGILKDTSDVLTGEELMGMTDEELAESIDNFSVFARLLPDQKLRIVKVLKSKGMTVAITGDSVNDAQALSCADVGIAMGNKGTDVARGAADIIMNNNRFSSIISAINTSIGLFCSIRKTLTYLFSSDIGKLLAILLCLIIFKDFPLAAAPLLLINLITDTFPILAIISDGIYEHKSMHIFSSEDKALFTVKSKTVLTVQSVIIASVALIAYCISVGHGTTLASTMMFTVLAFSLLMNMITIKFEDFFFKYKHFTNMRVSIILAALTLLILLLVLTPVGSFFGMCSLSLPNFMSAFALSILVLISGELVKLGFLLYKKFSK